MKVLFTLLYAGEISAKGSVITISAIRNSF